MHEEKKSGFQLGFEKLASFGKDMAKLNLQLLYPKASGKRDKLFCNECPEYFPDKLYLKKHIEDVHKELKNGFQCEYCEKTFKYRSSLKRHIESVHEGQKTHQCSDCEAKFSEKRNLKRHIATVHEKKKPFQCEICEFRYGTKIDLKMHIASVHEGHKPHHCSDCEAKFSNKGHLKSHIVTVHKKKKQFQCDNVTSVNLNVVQKVISKVTLQLCMKRRRHSSVTCEFRYGSKSHLKRHIASVHEGQKPYHSRSLNSYRIIKNT